MTRYRIVARCINSVARMVKVGSAANNAGSDIRRRVEGVHLGSSLQGTRHVEKAVRRLHHPPPDGFAKLLGGENFGSSIPALHFGGKTAMTRPFQGYAQFGLFDWTFVLESRTSARYKAVYSRRCGPMVWCGRWRSRGQRGIGAAVLIYLHIKSGINDAIAAIDRKQTP